MVEELPDIINENETITQLQNLNENKSINNGDIDTNIFDSLAQEYYNYCHGTKTKFKRLNTWEILSAG